MGASAGTCFLATHPLACIRPTPPAEPQAARGVRLAAAADRAAEAVFVVGAPSTLGRPAPPPPRVKPAPCNPPSATATAVARTPLPALSPLVPYGVGCLAADIFVLLGNAGRALNADVRTCLASLRRGTYAITEAHLGVFHGRWVHAARHTRLYLAVASQVWGGWLAAPTSDGVVCALARLTATAAGARAAWAAVATAPDAAAALPALWAAIASAASAAAAAYRAVEGVLPAAVAASAVGAAAPASAAATVGRLRDAADAAAAVAAMEVHGAADGVHLLTRWAGGGGGGRAAALARRLRRLAARTPGGGGGGPRGRRGTAPPPRRRASGRRAKWGRSGFSTMRRGGGVGGTG
ncbi:hypothetical protein BU14_0313s0026 [Porphyra umbilicalis]|uniref:Uncharacterized protein n=1 Tax=Porphyra umbilicalis TaxID=2786 RepID=A0A1X6NZJ5_PORUM|nr:hypothetical protein BU14_0313s0026 [Porphyra umbilicalis]|eukprot:OSX74041.1 hypothetical protein BU14_0313s0026 [Porphyra umbilicalis]